MTTMAMHVNNEEVPTMGKIRSSDFVVCAFFFKIHSFFVCEFAMHIDMNGPFSFIMITTILRALPLDHAKGGTETMIQQANCRTTVHNSDNNKNGQST